MKWWAYFFFFTLSVCLVVPSISGVAHAADLYQLLQFQNQSHTRAEYDQHLEESNDRRKDVLALMDRWCIPTLEVTCEVDLGAETCFSVAKSAHKVAIFQEAIRVAVEIPDGKLSALQEAVLDGDLFFFKFLFQLRRENKRWSVPPEFYPAVLGSLEFLIRSELPSFAEKALFLMSFRTLLKQHLSQASYSTRYSFSWRLLQDVEKLIKKDPALKIAVETLQLTL